MKTLELLAPARNTDIGIAAIDCGADAVYIAGPSFGARQAAGNSIEDIGRLCDYAHRFGARIFAAFNTVIYDSELEEAYKMMEALKSAGIDAFILQDLGLTDAAKKACGRAFEEVGIPLHASTQCAIRTPEDAIFYEQLGFSRLILERELSLERIRAIREAVNCELEFFVHGALCVCYSGQCYMSEYIDSRSANRGACMQACRSRYDLTDLSGKMISANRCHLSLKDFNLKDRIEDLADSGISSFKIEGRLKNISYVKNIVREYSAALDRLVEKRPGEFVRASFGKVTGGFVPRPEKTFNRGYTELFIDGTKGDWACPDHAKSIGEEIGTVQEVDYRRNSLTVKPLDASLKLNNGDGFCIVAAGQETAGFRGDVCTGMTITTSALPDGVKSGQKIYRNIDTAFEKEIERNVPQRKIAVSLNIVSKPADGAPILQIDAVSEDGRKTSVTYGEATDKAENAERMKSLIINQLSKSSEIYSFSVTTLAGEVFPFVPASVLNSLRRSIAEEFDKQGCNARPLNNSVPAERISTCKSFTYKDNIANEAARRLITQAGGRVIEPAYELSHRKDAELMRTKYCIRFQYGLCPRQKGGKTGSDFPGVKGSKTGSDFSEAKGSKTGSDFSGEKGGSLHGGRGSGALLLVNNGRKFLLEFDCAACEMTVRAVNRA